MKVYIFQTIPDYDQDAEIIKVFDSKEKAEKWNLRMEELTVLHNKYHEDGTVDRSGGGTSECPEIQALVKEAGSENYEGQIIEKEVE